MQANDSFRTLGYFVCQSNLRVHPVAHLDFCRWWFKRFLHRCCGAEVLRC